MELANLQAFIHVADSGSFSIAARQLFVTQPAVSKRIRQLESQLDSQLINRRGKQLHLTQTGEYLLPRARQIVNDMQLIHQHIADMEGNPMGSLRMATSHHIGLHRLPPILRAFSAQYPDVDLDLNFMDSERACELVEQNELEIAVVTLPFSDSAQLRFTPVWTDHLRITCATAHPLRKLASPRIDDLIEHAAVLPSHGTFTREAIEQALHEIRDRLRVTLETNYLETIKMMVSVGLGWSILPESMLDDGLEIVHVPAFRAQRRLGLVTHRQRSPSRAAESMIQLIETYRSSNVEPVKANRAE